MSEVRKSLGVGGIALVPIACCIGLPLLAAAGVGAAALVWGGAVVGGIVVATLAGVVLLRRRARAAACPRHSWSGRRRGTRLQRLERRSFSDER
jgi:hypothetical protein